MLDMLSQRYACPFFILDEFISLNQLHDFLIEFSSLIVEEKKEQVRWEFFLHKVFDKSYSEFLNSIDEGKVEEMTDETIKDVVGESMNILDGFTF